MADTPESTSIRPLGRSLDPLPGESLSGYVLRLAHRLRVSPDQIVRRTGLADIQGNTQAMAKSAYSTLLPEDKATDFAAAACLTPTEASALTLAPWASRYPPIARTLDCFQLAQRVPQLDGLFATTARYCPACLAGDGSPIQNLHGGPWQRSWRLPVFFACLRHQRFLEHLCPACHRPVGTNSYSHLIGRPTIPGIHPAHCRQPHPQAKSRPRTRDAICQGRLDQIELHPADRPEPELLTLQHKIADMLAPEESAVLASQYFTELQLVTALVIITWPRTRPSTHCTAVTAADQYVAEHHPPQQRHYSNAPPTDARACAAFLHAADTLLSADDLRIALAPLAPVENRTRTGINPQRHRSWDSAFKKHHDACSPRFQLAAETLVPSFRRTRPGGRRVALSRVGYKPEHVPAFLLQEWADQHLSTFTGASTRLLRRTAAAYLVRRASGGSLNEASQFLGISSSDKRIGFATVLGKWIRTQDNLHAFDSAVDAIATDLEAAPPIDYRRRRQALFNWTLPADHWHEMLARLTIPPGNGAITDDRKRLAVTGYIWARVTQGEIRLSPCPADIVNDPAARHAWQRQRAETAHWLKTDSVHYYHQLKPLLDAYADQLAHYIEAGLPPPEQIPVTTSPPL
ncbi:TniQ family protein [Streptomyces sp. NPDC002409]